MKKSLFLGAFAFLTLGIVNVNAVHVTGDDTIGYEGSNVTVREQEGTYYVTLTDDAEQDFEIKKGEKVVLDLAGHTFTNSDGCKACSVIWLLDGGDLTIIDSSEEHSGKIYRQAGSNEGVAVINNVTSDGTVTVKGGTISATITGEHAISNSGTLIFEDGTIETKIDGAWGIMNYKTATISGGNFVQGNDFSVVYNAGDMEITGGKFSSTGDGHYSLLTNQASGDGVANLAISGGDFKTDEDSPLFRNEGKNELEISGGTYSSNVEKYINDEYTFETDETGNVTVVKKPTTEEVKDEPIVEEEKEETPNTYDGILSYLLLGVISLIGIASLTIVLKKKKRLN